MSSPALLPGVMVSSTFYDLKHLRDDLRRFLEDGLGYRPLLSEHNSFPINPELSTIANCRARVEHDADVLVLVIGRRYGSLDDRSAKSVTNLEYLAAREKGIPIYAFIERGVLALLPVWQANKMADFTGQVDSPALFGFVQQVTQTDRVWVREFEHAADVIDSLRIQFAYQHRAGLVLAQRIRGVGDRRWMQDLDGETLRIGLERPAYWEYRLFGAALTNAIARYDRQKRRHESGVPSSLGEDVVNPTQWLLARFSDAERLAGGLSTLLNRELQAAFGPDGEPGDRERILFIADSMAERYGECLEWADRVASANIAAVFRPAAATAARLLDEAVHEVEAFGPRVSMSVDEALAAHRQSGVRQVLNLTLTISIAQGAIEEFSAKLAEAAGEEGIED